jgi:hypothetical protein
MTSHELAHRLLELPDRKVVTSDDPDDGYNFHAGGVEEMVLTVEGSLYDTIQDKEKEESWSGLVPVEVVEVVEKVIVIIP